ncbi:MAG: DUF4149 domain-containing protein [Proteobacteria bacterium]|jgi:uncharacterized membrane protein|nr:DUF4149 domain-containing protein [Pseudomonadota bacterium]MCG6934390.1 DUF4149 domain-containing protein [Pseudomonadota bacterium]
MKLFIGERILLTLWVGGMWTVGYIVTPTLFNMLESRMLAGDVAGRLFTLLSYLGLISGAVLLTGQLYRSTVDWQRNWRVGVLLLMVLVIVIGEFVLQPMMAQLKETGLIKGSDAASQFGRLHGVASLLFLLNSLLGLALVVFGLEKQTKQGDGS